MAPLLLRSDLSRPTETAMQTEQKRTCAKCGADNPQDAGFCWQCYTPFAPAAPGGRQVPTMPAMPTTAGPVLSAPVQSSAPGGGRRIARIAVGVVIAIVVAGVVRNMLTPSYHVPETLGGAPRLHTADAQKFEQEMIAEGQKYDVDFEAAVYGQADTPDVFLVLANGHAEESADELFNDFLSGVESAGVTIDRSQAITGQHGDAEYRCVPLSAQIDAAACVWREDRSVGLTLDGSPDGDDTAALFTAYDAVHA
jgi:ribosomal protein L40E